MKNTSTVPSKPDLAEHQTTTFVQPQPPPPQPMTNQNPNTATPSGMMNQQHPMNANINFGSSSENVSTNINFSMSNILDPREMETNSMLQSNLNQMDSSNVQITPVIANTLINNMQMQSTAMDTTAYVGVASSSSNN